MVYLFMQYKWKTEGQHTCHCFTAWVAAAGASLWLGWLWPAEAAPSVKWRVPDATDRVLFEPSGTSAESCHLVALPLDGNAAEPAGLVAIAPGGMQIPVRHLVTRHGQAWVLVQVGNAKDRQGVFSVYYGGKAAGSTAAGPDVSSKSPVLSKLYRGSGKGIPNTLNKLIYILSTQRTPLVETQEKSLGSVPELPVTEDDQARHSWKRPPRKQRGNLVMLHNRSMVMFPEDGIYRLAIDCEDAGAVFVDDQAAVEWLGEHASGKWKEGVPLFLRAGPHRVEVRCVFDQYGKMEIGWKTPSSKSIVPIPFSALLTSAEGTIIRHEVMGRTLHAGFTAAVQPAYKFKGNPILFVPVRFTDRSDNWLAVGVKRRWTFPDNRSAMGVPFSSDDALSSATWGKENLSVMHVFKGADVFRARLDLRDELGFTAFAERDVDCRMKPYTEYIASAWLEAVPSASFEADQVKPVLRIDGSAPGWANFKFDAIISARSGGKVHKAIDASLLRPVRETMQESPDAGQIMDILWTCAHEDALLASGRVRFLRYPFAEVPVSAEEDRLYDRSGVQLAFVSMRSAGLYRQDKINFRPREDRLVWLDDTLCGVSAVDPLKQNAARVLARVTGVENERLVLRRIDEWGKSSGQFGGLNAILAAGAAAESDATLVIVSLGAQDLMRGASIDDFERRLAVIVDMLASRKKKILLVTPPVSPGAETGVRSFAAAIRMTADARSIPVADLYSAFMGMGVERDRLWEQGGMELSADGIRLAAQVMARAMTGK
jgi:hypothetical protein